MVLDTSALLVILLAEPEASTFRQAIQDDPIRLLSAGTLLEAGIVIEGRAGESGGSELDLLIFKAGISVVAVDLAQVEVARQAFRDYGKGRHPAGLNFGDCFAYALARTSGEPLLYKGNDFSRTDVRSALPAAG